MNINEGTPKKVSFLTNANCIITVDTKNKYFPAHITSNSKILNFKFYSTFTGTEPSPNEYDTFGQGNFCSIFIPQHIQKIQNLKGTLTRPECCLKIFIHCRRKVEVMFSVSFTSKIHQENSGPNFIFS